MLKLITDNIIEKPNKKQLKKYQSHINKINSCINLRSLAGCDMMGWIDLINTYDNHELLAMQHKANEWHKLGINQVLVIGIGGSYIGVKAGIDMCCGLNDAKTPEILWLHNIGTDYLLSLYKRLKNKTFGIIVISKSGTTLEPALGFRMFRELLEKKVGSKNLHKYIVAITDYEKGTLHDFAKKRHYTMFGIRNDIGGRFSTLTPVGMFAMILKHLDPLAILRGAKQALKDASQPLIENNSAYQYAVYRHFLHTVKHYQIENFIVYEPCLTFVGEMWKQIYGESEGKNHKSLYPAVSLFTTDLHSLGQYLQEGSRNFIETTLFVNTPKEDLKLKVTDNFDGLRYLNNKKLSFINEKAFIATVDAHSKLAKANNFIIKIDNSDEYHFGYIFTWFAMAVTISGYLLDINPFNQPGVEAYKNNMFKLLGRKK